MSQPATFELVSDADLIVTIDVNCPACHWPERHYTTGTRQFGCPRCPYVSDERNA